MSERNGTAKIDMGLGSLFDFCLPDHDRGDSLSGDEIHAYKADNDDGASEVFCPVTDFLRKCNENRFDTSKSAGTFDSTWNEPIGAAVVEKKAKVARYEVKADAMGDRISYGYDERGELIAYRWLTGKEE